MTVKDKTSNIICICSLACSEVCKDCQKNKDLKPFKKYQIANWPKRAGKTKLNKDTSILRYYGGLDT